MTAPSMEVTQLLLAWSEGEQSSFNQLTPLVYEELRRLAHEYMRRENPGHMLQTTALINEAYLRLADLKRVRWQNPAQFFGIAAQLMQHILVDYARSRHYQKRGGAARQVSLDEAMTIAKKRDTKFIALDDALEGLAAIDPRKSRIVELRYFNGLSVKKTTEILHVSPRTVLREWELARAWLHR